MLAKISPLQFLLTEHKTSPFPPGSLLLCLKAAVTSPLSTMSLQSNMPDLLLIWHDLQVLNHLAHPPLDVLQFNTVPSFNSIAENGTQYCRNGLRQNKNHCLLLKELQATRIIWSREGFLLLLSEGGVCVCVCFVLLFAGVEMEGRVLSFCDSGIKFKNTNENGLSARLTIRDFWRNKWVSYSPERVHILLSSPCHVAFMRITVTGLFDEVCLH